MRSYSSTDFLAKLSADSLDDPVDVAVLGLVRVDRSNASFLQFSSSSSCDRWLPVPTEVIESIDHLKTVSCKDHQHPLVKIKLKRPDATRQDALFFFNLIFHLQALLALTLKDARTRVYSGAAGKDFCFIWEDPQGYMVCCFHGDNLDCTGMV